MPYDWDQHDRRLVWRQSPWWRRLWAWLVGW
jgi:hypothetical protein